MFAVSLLQEQCHEWQHHVWLSALDFKKAFGCVEHNFMWRSLADQGVPAGYVSLLQNLYSGQTARVRTDCMSKPYDFQRGTKQGDPLSSLLFNSLIETVVSKFKQKWLAKGCGLKKGATDLTQLTNLRLAGDILLVAATLRQLKAMIEDIKIASAEVGLELHPDRTNIQ
eukprot:8749563-Pyramimonas_sp.AAC.1